MVKDRVACPLVKEEPERSRSGSRQGARRACNAAHLLKIESRFLKEDPSHSNQASARCFLITFRMYRLSRQPRTAKHAITTKTIR